MTVRRADSLDRMFKRNQLSRTDLANIMELEDARKYLRLVKPGDKIKVTEADSGEILSLERQISLSEVLSIRKTEDAFTAKSLNRHWKRRRCRPRAQINSSLFLAAAEAGISDRLIMNLAGIFAWDIDFVLDIREGDEFSLVYEEFWQDGKRIAEGEILAAEFINRGKSYRAVRYKDASGRVDYYTPDGHSVRKAFVRAPLSFSRISSNFNPKRRHPKLNTIRAHKGVDYAAPTGTPIKAAGDGKIIHRGTSRAVTARPSSSSTAAISRRCMRTCPGTRKPRVGSRVRQGDIIGYVGCHRTRDRPAPALRISPPWRTPESTHGETAGRGTDRRGLPGRLPAGGCTAAAVVSTTNAHSSPPKHADPDEPDQFMHMTRAVSSD